MRRTGVRAQLRAAAPHMQALAEGESGAYSLNVAAFMLLSLGGTLLVAIRVGIPSALAK